MSEVNTPVSPEAIQAEGTEQNQQNEATNEEVESSSDSPAEKPAAPEENSITNAMKEVEAKQEAMRKKFKLKVDGQEFEEEIDLSNDEELTKRLQLAKVAQKRMQESAQYKKAIQDFYDMLQQNPDEALAQLGFDPLQYSEARIKREIEERKKSPEQKEFERQQQELEKYKKKLDAIQKEKEEAELASLEERYHRQIEDEIVSAIDKVSDVPKSAYFIKRVSDMMRSFILNGKTDVTANEVVPLVRKQIKAELKQMYDTASEDILEDIWGKSNLERLRKKRIAKAREAKKLQTAKSVQSSGNKELGSSMEKESNGKKIPMNDFFRNLK